MIVALLAAMIFALLSALFTALFNALFNATIRRSIRRSIRHSIRRSFLITCRSLPTRCKLVCTLRALPGASSLTLKLEPPSFSLSSTVITIADNRLKSPGIVHKLCTRKCAIRTSREHWQRLSEGIGKALERHWKGTSMASTRHWKALEHSVARSRQAMIFKAAAMPGTAPRATLI